MTTLNNIRETIVIALCEIAQGICKNYYKHGFDTFEHEQAYKASLGLIEVLNEPLHEDTEKELIAKAILELDTPNDFIIEHIPMALRLIKKYNWMLEK